MSIPVIDVFSGPGGLGEGFSTCGGGRDFHILVSAEMNAAARSTLRLRAYFRRVRSESKDARAYYDFCNGVTDSPWNERTASAWNDAAQEARQLTLGEPESDRELDEILSQRLRAEDTCVLIGGPPCQAYSLVGRARNQGVEGYRPEEDHRHFLYQDYLRIIHRAKPTVFVMENVKGILSSKVFGTKIFHQILKDLADPRMALTQKLGQPSERYRICSLVADTCFESGMDPESVDPASFVVRSEQFGIPQARHRVILIGIRQDIDLPAVKIESGEAMTVRDAIADLPRLRSRLSDGNDDPVRWSALMKEHMSGLAAEARVAGHERIATELEFALGAIADDMPFGALRFDSSLLDTAVPNRLSAWYRDTALDVILNHETRSHMPSDLRRYAFAAAYARAHNVSPKGPAGFFLSGLRPNHANWESGHFADRFRVQLADAPSATVTSHISKDGHYFIHPDTSQCRSLTVREAARLQTFPDNYFFQGNRTEQFHQVGNAVPPLLALRIATAVRNAMKRVSSAERTIT